MEKKRNTAPENLLPGETKIFHLDNSNEFETTDIHTEVGASYILLDKTNNGAKVTYKFHDSQGVGFKDLFNRIIENSEGSPFIYFASDEKTDLKVKRIS